ncbi:MAG: HAMP domain-containing histidine kinase [Firmicutes bacterium]|nr:HAMP domain-containing histidine kinase [Bacillota bacterium]
MTDIKKRSTRKLSRQIMGLLAVTLVISFVIFWTISLCGSAIIEHICYSRGVTITQRLSDDIRGWVFNVSLLISVGVFVVLLMFLMGERIAEALKKIEDKERALSEEREELIRSLSHDIRTPLTSIMSYSEFLLLEEERSQEEYRKYLELIRKKGAQIKELTDVLLDGGRRDLQFFEDGRLLMEQLAAEFEEMLEDDFDIRQDIERCGKFKGNFDINEMRRIFDNLISNVKKYAEPSGKVELIIETDKSGLIIIQRNKIRHITGEVESNKIGLAGIKRIAQNYGGNIAVTSEGDDFEIMITLSEF